MTDKIKQISQNTLVPIGFIIVLAVGLRWVDNVAFTSSANAAAVAELQRAQTQIAADLAQIKIDVAVIKVRTESIK